jgi:hypothetical protein
MHDDGREFQMPGRVRRKRCPHKKPYKLLLLLKEPSGHVFGLRARGHCLAGVNCFLTTAFLYAAIHPVWPLRRD